MDKVEFRRIPLLIATPPLRPTYVKDLSAIENQLGFLFPEGYRAFITTLGVGKTELGIRVLSPKHCLDGRLSEIHDRLSEHWVWDKGTEVLTQAQAITLTFFRSTSTIVIMSL